MKIAVVTSRFNEDITERLLEGALNVLETAEVEIFSVKVPGAVEIPLTIKVMFEQGCDAAVALGAVIRGETSHYDLVCNSVERGVTQVMLETGKSIGFGVITTEDEEQALERVGGKQGQKGEEAALVALEMVGLINSLKKMNRKK